MKKIQLFLIVLLVGIQAAMAQSVQISGKVTYADDGAPVIGATINVKGTSVATLSDVNGEYKLTIPAKDSKIVVVSYTGLLTQEIPTPTSGVYNVVLATDALNADEVVVTGYGNVSRKNYTGAAAVVSTEKLKDVPSVSIASRLAGNVAGLTVTSSSGAPGSVESIRIRGIGSINASNEPLFVLDGVPMVTGNANPFSYSVAGNSMLATINPADIESMTVIKDAAAASLYGSRAANGVVVITTKKGASGKTRFNVKADLGFSDMAVNWRPVLNGADRRSVLHMGLYNEQKYVLGKTDAQAIAHADAEIDKYAKPLYGTDPSNPANYTDWRNLLFRQGLNQNYEVSAQGGSDKTKFYASLGYTDTKGITAKQSYDRISGRVNLDHKSGIFTLNVASSFSAVKQSFDSEGTSYSSPFMFTGFTGNPSDRAYNPDGSINTTDGFFLLGGSGLANPLQENAVNYNTSNITRTMNTISGQLDLFKGFAVKETLSYDYSMSKNNVWWDPRSNNGAAWNGVLQVINVNNTRLTSQTMATYNRLFADVHSLNLLASFEAEDTAEGFLQGSGDNYPSYKKPALDNAANSTSAGSLSRYTMLSWLIKGDYVYDNRIYISGSYRMDGSSRLSPETRWGSFFSASAAWTLSNERWYKEGGISRVLTSAKIRASYGENGTQPDAWYGWQGTYGYGFNYGGQPGMAENRIPNNELKWEKSLSANLGIDVSFIDRINVSIELYNRDTKDLIMDVPISQTTGFATTLKNVGAMNNKGIEFTLNAIAIQTKDVTWNLGFNISHNKNKVVKLNDGDIINGVIVHSEGHSLYSFWTRRFAGIDAATGGELWYVNQGDNPDEITSDYTKAGRSIQDSKEPIVYGGLNSQFNYKWLDFGFTFSYSIGGHAYDNNGWGQGAGTDNNYYGMLPTYYKQDRLWTKPGDIAPMQMFAHGSIGTIGSNRYVVSTDFLRLKNLTLGFSAPKSWIGKAGIEKLRIYAAANNLFTIKSKDCAFDPEVPYNGLVNFDAPQLRTVTFGIEIGF